MIHDVGVMLALLDNDALARMYAVEEAERETMRTIAAQYGEAAE